MTADCALVFPGQGSQYPGMGKDLYAAFDEARQTFEQASEAVGRDMAALCFDGTPEELDSTINTQTAVFTVDMAAFRVFERYSSVSPIAAAGHSLGEYAALASAGALPFPDMLRLVKARATYMHEAVPEGSGAMAAIMNLDGSTLDRICRESNRDGEIVAAANFNGPSQLVISGTTAAVDDVIRRAQAEGGRGRRLSVSVPCHCGLLDEASRRLDDTLSTVSFKNCTIPVIPNCDPTLTHTRESTRSLLVRQLTDPVRWQETIERMAGAGVTTIVELGPKKTLSGLIKRIVPGIRLFNIEDRRSLEETLAGL